MFQFLNAQSAKLLSFTGRTEVHGPDRVPAVSFRLKFSGPNTLLDLLSPSLRLAVYTAAEGQVDLPGVDPTTPLLRSRDVKHLALDNCYEGWTVKIEHGINETTHLEMGLAKIDAFEVDFHDGGTVDIECRVSTASIDKAGVGELWAKQTREVPVCLIAPKTLETNPNAGQTIDGTKGPGLFEQAGDAKTPEQALAEAVTPQPPADGQNWPFPKKKGSKQAEAAA